jgi:hypothetical protein
MNHTALSANVGVTILRENNKYRGRGGAVCREDRIVPDSACYKYRTVTCAVWETPAPTELPGPVVPLRLSVSPIIDNA